MRETSFGYLQEFEIENRGRVEFLSFKTSGRLHKHREKESVFITSGSGEIYIGEDVIRVAKGDIVTIDALEAHYMKPSQGECLELVLWYH